VKGWCESSNEPPGSTKCGEFRNYIRNLPPFQEERNFIQSESLGRFISSFGLSMTGTSAHIKVKVHPRTDREGPDGEYRYSHTLSLTSALDGDGWSTPRLGRFSAGKDPVPIVQEVGWASGPVWTGAENLAYSGIRSPDRLARSESQYRLSYPGPPSAHLLIQIYKERPFNKAVSRRLSTANSRLQYQTRPCEICSRRRNSGTSFLRITVFHCHYNYTSAPCTFNNFSARLHNLWNCHCL